MAKTQCTDRVVGAILSSWRYDISGISPDMRRDYVHHFEECLHCRQRQKLHRAIDVTLATLTAASVLVFLLALAVIHRIEPLQHWALVDLELERVTIYLTLSSAAVAGLLFSIAAFVLVATMTPAPGYLTGMARERARELEQQLPEEIRERLPRNIA
jgi:hypothetical protein